MLISAAPASATTYCVSDPACVTAGGTTSLDLGTALASASSDPGSDRVEVGVGTFDENGSGGSGFLYMTGGPLQLVGEGPGQTVLKDTAPVLNEPVLQVVGSTTSVSGFSLEMNTTDERGLRLDGGASASNVEARLGLAAPGSTVGFVIVDGAGGSLSNATAALAAGTSNLAINVIGVPGVTIQDVQLSAASGIEIGVSSSSAENVIRRARITVTAGNGVSVTRGTATIESSLVQVLGASGRGFIVSNTNNLTEAFDLEARHVTLIGPGTGVGGTGAEVRAAVTAGVQLPSVLLRDSIVFAFQGPLRCADASTGDDDIPALATDYSDYPSSGVSIDPGCVPTFTETNHLTADPMFVNPASDFHLLATSPLVDAGTPGVLGGAESPTDLDGNPRLADGNGDSTARRDLGAFEYTPPAPPGGGAATPRSFFGDLVLRAKSKKGKLVGRLSSDGASCLSGRLIEFFRVKKGPDPRVGTAFAGSDGTFRLARRVSPGRYYAEAGALSLPGGDSCAADRSAKAKLKPAGP